MPILLFEILMRNCKNFVIDLRKWYAFSMVNLNSLRLYPQLNTFLHMLCDSGEKGVIRLIGEPSSNHVLEFEVFNMQKEWIFHVDNNRIENMWMDEREYERSIRYVDICVDNWKIWENFGNGHVQRLENESLQRDVKRYKKTVRMFEYVLDQQPFVGHVRLLSDEIKDVEIRRIVLTISESEWIEWWNLHLFQHDFGISELDMWFSVSFQILIEYRNAYIVTKCLRMKLILGHILRNVTSQNCSRMDFMTLMNISPSIVVEKIILVPLRKVTNRNIFLFLLLLLLCISFLLLLLWLVLVWRFLNFQALFVFILRIVLTEDIVHIVEPLISKMMNDSESRFEELRKGFQSIAEERKHQETVLATIEETSKTREAEFSKLHEAEMQMLQSRLNEMRVSYFYSVSFVDRRL